MFALLESAATGGAMANLTDLRLYGNRIGGAGLLALSNALAAGGSMANVKLLCVDRDTAGGALLRVCEERRIELFIDGVQAVQGG